MFSRPRKSPKEEVRGIHFNHQIITHRKENLNSYLIIFFQIIFIKKTSDPTEIEKKI